MILRNLCILIIKHKATIVVYIILNRHWKNRRDVFLNRINNDSEKIIKYLYFIVNIVKSDYDSD